AGADRNCMPVLDYRHKGSAVRYIRDPVVKPATQQICVVLADGDRYRAPRHVLGKHVSGSRRDSRDRRMGRKEAAITVLVNGQLSHVPAPGFLAGQLFKRARQLIWNVRTKPADDVGSGPHQSEPRRRTSVPLIDLDDAPT